MVELSLMASTILSPGAFNYDQSLFRAPKEVLLGYDDRKDILIAASMPIGYAHVEDKWQPKDQWAYNQPQRSSAVVGKPLLLDIQDIHRDSVLFSFGIAEQCARHEKMIKLLLSRLNSEDCIDTSLLDDLVEVKSLAADSWSELHTRRGDAFCHFGGGSSCSEHFLITNRQIHIPYSLLDFGGNCSNASHTFVHPDGQILLTSSESKINDAIPVASEFSQLKGFTTSNKQMMVVPYFTRSRGGHVKIKSQESVITNQTTAPSGSPETIKLKSPPKKLNKNKNKKSVMERDPYQKNYLLACESLLSAILNKNDKKETGKILLSLKKLPELPHLLSQFAAGIAGTGIAILFSAASGKAPFAVAKLLNTALGFGFLWLSWAVNRLSDTINDSSRNLNKFRLTDIEIVQRIESNVKEVLLRFTALVAMGMLKFV